MEILLKVSLYFSSSGWIWEFKLWLYSLISWLVSGVKKSEFLKGLLFDCAFENARPLPNSAGLAISVYYLSFLFSWFL